MKKTLAALFGASLLTLLMPLCSASAADAAAETANVPIYNMFKFDVDTELQQTFFESGKHNFTVSLANEPGTLSMNIVRSKDNPSEVYVVEVYANQAAYEAHRASPQFKSYVEDIGSKLTNRTVYSLTPVFLMEKPSPLHFENDETVRVNMARVKVLPEKQEMFTRIIVNEMKESVSEEPGVLLIYAGRDKADPDAWYFFEIYRDDAAYEAHRETQVFKDYISSTKDMVTDKWVTTVDAVLMMNQGGLFYEAN